MKKLNIHITAALLALVLVLGGVCAAYAVGTDYSGILDPETYEPIGSPESSSANRVALSGTMLYDWNSHRYVYLVENSLLEVYSNVADGMVISEAASVSAAGDPSVRVFCNGTECADISNLREIGDYVVSVRSSGNSLRLFDFTIVGPTTNSLHQYMVPEGFYINSATRNGENIFTDRYRVNMEEEGDYVIEYECSYTDLVYKLETTIDRTPPSLTFQGRVDSKQRVHSALSFSGLEEGDTILLLRDAEEAKPVLNGDGTGRILDPGNYIMRVFDAAGNEREYNFTIMMYFNASSWFFFISVLAVIAAVVIYVFVKRKKLKIG